VAIFLFVFGLGMVLFVASSDLTDNSVSTPEHIAPSEHAYDASQIVVLE
jgi:hypothetical protein